MTSSRIDVIPESHRALLDGPVVVSLATQMKSGQIQVQPVWCSYDGRHILVNTEKQGRPPHPLHQVGAERARRCPRVARPRWRHRR